MVIYRDSLLYKNLNYDYFIDYEALIKDKMVKVNPKKGNRNIVKKLNQSFDFILLFEYGIYDKSIEYFKVFYPYEEEKFLPSVVNIIVDNLKYGCRDTGRFVGKAVGKNGKIEINYNYLELGW